MPRHLTLPNPDTTSAGPLFGTVWHALSLAIVMAVPAYVEWGESLASLPVGWMPHVVAMGAAYLALATLVVLMRPGRTLRGVLDVVAATVGVYGAALVLLSARPDIPVSRQVVAFSMSLAFFFALLPIVLQQAASVRLRDSGRASLAVSGLWNQTSSRIPLHGGLRGLEVTEQSAIRHRLTNRDSSRSTAWTSSSGSRRRRARVRLPRVRVAGLNTLTSSSMDIRR